MKRAFTIVGLGEALFDVYPDRAILGGAPLNVAVHAHQLASTAGGCGIPASRIGRDELGARLLEELSARGIPTTAIQQDEHCPTGRVLVTLRGGEPDYEIVPDAAWDRLEFSDELRRVARTCDAVCFGTLGQRSPQAHETIVQFLQEARQAVRLFDVNLRQDFFSAEVVERSAALATVVKVNEQELPTIDRLIGLYGTEVSGTTSQDQQVRTLCERFALDAVVVTRGAAGTVLYTAAGKTERAPAGYPPHPEADSVGAGDACAAGILMGMLLGWPAGRIVDLANSAGAYVASQPGATPALPRALLESMDGGPLQDSA
jgi:fructokinase